LVEAGSFDLMADVNPKTVLLVEDDGDIRDTLSLSLERCGYRVVAASQGREGLQRLDELGAPPDLILLDWMMPVMSGPDFLEKLDTMGMCRGVPIVVLSAVDRVVNLGGIQVTAVIPKPVRLRTLVDVIDRLLGLEKRNGGYFAGISGRVNALRGDPTPLASGRPRANTVALRKRRVGGTRP
jgi:CheY-like chemotaxis protein